MNNFYSGSIKDTIAAIATALGTGGIGIIRISGSRAKTVLGKLFIPSSARFKDFRPWFMQHGHVHDPNTKEVLDEVLTVFMPGPHSFTGEDVAELHCHGGQALLQTVLTAVTGCGVRLAGPGEFTFRAFWHGRLDLTQAEAVAEVITAPTKAGLFLAQNKLSGGLGEKISQLRHKLEELRIKLCVAVDFPEEEVECLSLDTFFNAVTEVKEDVAGLIQNFQRGRHLREGVLAVLTGQVNAGKSSLMNALLGRKRAIVTSHPGTTRDYLEEILDLEGLPVRLVDTAGLRSTGDVVEQAGLEYAHELAENAHLVLLVVDGTKPLAEEDRGVVEKISAGHLIIVSNKKDLGDPHPEVLALENNFPLVKVSAKTGDNLEELAGLMRQSILGHGKEAEGGHLVPNLRQAEALVATQKELAALKNDIVQKVPYDLMGVRLEAVCTMLAEITGEIHSQDILNAVFSEFCIGK